MKTNTGSALHFERTADITQQQINHAQKSKTGNAMEKREMIIITSPLIRAAIDRLIAVDDTYVAAETTAAAIRTTHIKLRLNEIHKSNLCE